MTADTTSALERVENALSMIAKRDERIGAFLHVDAEGARECARQIDANDHDGPLAGMPVAIKDNINLINQPTTCGSKILKDFISPYNATVVEKLVAAGAVFVGKTNMDEFAMGSSTEYSALKQTRNPVNPEHVPGGSSGGSAAAVAAGMVPLALGSSTGGSIRQPASFCGVVGMKPTYGRVSRYGLVAYGSSLDQIGPLAANVTGAARLYQVISGYDPKDATSADHPVEDVLTQLDTPPEKLRVGIVDEFSIDGLQPEVRGTMDRAIAALEGAGATIKRCSFPHTEYSIPAYYLVATAEASANLSRFDGVRYAHRSEDSRNLRDMYVHSRGEGFGPEVKRRILLGTYCLSSGYYEGYYLNAQKVRTKIIDDFRTAFEDVDVILAPTSPTTAFRFGEKTDDPVAMYLSDIYTVTANLAGVPALSLPFGKDEAGLPIGLQLMAKHFDEASLFRAARWLETLK
jgi:aspartyl-tRNA(Asn)/glutamyl-tRNA(Gln) amidotransferase subunit A